MAAEDIFDELEAFLDDAAPPTVTSQNEPSSVATPMANPTTPGQTSNMNQFSPSGQGGVCMRGASGGSVSSAMMNNGYPSNGCSPTTKTLLSNRLESRLQTQLGGRGENSLSGDLKRKMEDGLGGANDGSFNKAPKLEVKDEPSQQHGNGMFIKTDIKEETSGSQLEAILGLNSSTSDMKPKSELGTMSGGVMDVKQDYSQISNKPPPTQTGGILAKALMETRREPVSNNNMSMFNNNPGTNMRTAGMNPNNFNGGRNIPDGNSMRSQMDPQSLKAVKKLQEVSKDTTLDHSTKQKKVFEIIKETPNVRQFLEWIEREKGKNGKGNLQRGTMGNMGSNDMGSLQSQGCPTSGGMMGNNCDQQSKSGSILPTNDPSLNGGGNIGSGHDFSPAPSCVMQPGSPMNFNGPSGGSMMSQDMDKHRMQQWDMNQQQLGGVNQRPQHLAASPNVMIGPQGGNVPTTQFMHGSGINARGMPPSNGVNGYGPGGPGMSNSPNMYHQAPNMIVGNGPGQNWSVMRQQPGMNKPSSIPPPNYPYRTPVNVRMGARDNIRGISPTIGGYLSNSPGQSNAFSGPTGPMRSNFPVGSSMGDQYPIRNPNYPNTMYGGPNSAQNINNGMPQMSVRMDIGFSNNPHGDGMTYPNGGPVGQGLGDNNYMNPMQPSRNGPMGAGGSMMVNQGMGSPMGNPSEFPRGMMHPSNPNLVRPPGHHMSPVAGGRTAIPHTSPMVQQHLMTGGNVNGLPTNINPGSPAQRMMTVNGPTSGGMFSANNGLPPPNMTVPDADIQRYGHTAPPNYFNNETVGDGASGANAPNTFNPSHQMHQPQMRSQTNQQPGGPVQNSYSVGGTNGDGNNRNYSPYNNHKGNGQSVNIGSNGQNMGCSSDNSSDPNQPVVNGWKQNAGELRKTLLTRLHQALSNQGDPNAQQIAENVEKNAFMQSSTQEVYTMKLAQWLANIFSKQTDGTEGSHDNKVGEHSSQQPTGYASDQFNSYEKEKEINNIGNAQHNQQTSNPSQVPHIEESNSPSTTSTTIADSSTLKEALSNTVTTNLQTAANNSEENICGNPEEEFFSSSSMNDNINNEVSAESGLDNSGKLSAPKTNPILEELIHGDTDISSFDNTGTSKLTNSAENGESELLNDSYSKTPNMMIGSIQGNEPSASTPNSVPQSNSSIYNMPSMSPSSSSSCATSCSSSNASITTASSTQNVECTDVGPATASNSTNPISSAPSSKTCDSPSMAFSENSIKIDDNQPGSIEHLNVSTSSSSSTKAFQPPANFPVSSIESNETGNKATLQNPGQCPSVSSAATISANNSCVTTLANKGSAMVTPVRRPSGKGINGQQSVNQTGQLSNHGNSTVLPSLPCSMNGQLSNGNVAVAGQNQPHSVDSGIGSPRSIASSTLYSPKIQGTSPSLNPISETLTSSASPPDKGSS